MLRQLTAYKVNMSPYVIPGLKTSNVGRMQDAIITATCDYYNVTYESICKRKRTRKVCEPRQVIMYMLWRYTTLSLREIGNVFGGYNHATVLNSRERVEDLLLTVPEMSKIITRIKIKAEIEDLPTPTNRVVNQLIEKQNDTNP